ncbi:MAG: response regulator transcription factor [Campylobacterota bacterium]|nr:response regulator transcription factor [Campylobacterota bacterium]
MNNISNLKQLKVLLVEDESSIAQLLYDAIADYFAEFRMATNGLEAIQSHGIHHYDIIITDITMPKMDGLEMTRKLKLIDPALPIIVLSAYSDTDKLLDSIDAGVMKYFIKPFDPDELLEYLIKLSTKLIDMNMIQLVDDFSYNNHTKQLFHKDQIIALSKREYKLIDILVQQRNDILEDRELKLLIWGDENINNERVRTFIKRIRQKTSKELIKNISTRGYCIVLA